MSTSLSIATWLKQAQHKLVQAGIGTARLDSLVLLEDMLNTNRAQLLAHPELKLTATQQAKLTRQLSRRTRHEPLAYIRGHTEFYGREFIITKAVLEPRPESEAMIDEAKSLLRTPENLHPELSENITTPKNTDSSSSAQRSARRTMQIADLGTGSGALGITLTMETGFKVDLLDIDTAALRVARKNAIKFSTPNLVIASDLLISAPHTYDLLLCNLPYVPDSFHINPAALNEPKIALFGGPDGLDVYRKLFGQLQSAKRPPKYVLTECLPPQHTKLAQLASAARYKLTKVNDFIQVFERL